MDEYKDLIHALEIISQTRDKITKTEGVESPAWAKLLRIGRYIAKQANDAIVGKCPSSL